MGAIRKVVTWRDDFDRAQALTTTAGFNGWTIRDTSTDGTPTYLCAAADGGGLVITLTNTNNVAEYVTAYHNDVLNFRLDKLQRIAISCSVSGVDNTTVACWGVAGPARTTHNAVPDAETYNAWFRIQGSASTSNIVVETDDTVTDNDDKATGKTLSSTLKRFEMDFTRGLSDVRFYIDGDRVAASTTFNMTTTPSQRVQPYIELQKGETDGTPSITVSSFEVQYVTGEGA